MRCCPWRTGRRQWPVAGGDGHDAGGYPDAGESRGGDVRQRGDVLDRDLDGGAEECAVRGRVPSERSVGAVMWGDLFRIRQLGHQDVTVNGIAPVNLTNPRTVAWSGLQYVT